MDNVLEQIQQKRQADQTYSGGGHPHTFVELFGGYIVPMLAAEPDIFSFRRDYYYNSSDNLLYIKKAEWVDLAKEFNSENAEFVFFNGRSIKKMVNEPNPKNFGDKYYYSIISKKIFGRIFKWVRCTNL